MNNLPIINNLPPSPARGTSGNTPLPRNDARVTADDGPANASTPGSTTRPRNAPAKASGNAANGAQANSAADNKAAGAQATEPFAALLARQILPAPEAAQTVIAIDGKAAGSGAGQIADDAQDQALLAANTPVDPANTLTAMLLQLPQELRTPVAGDAAGSTTTPLTNNGNATGSAITPSTGDTAATDLLVPNMARSAAKPGTAKPDLTDDAPGKKNISAIAFDKKTIADSSALSAAKHMELSASPSQPNQSITQASTSSAISAAMPNMLTGSKPSDNPQTITAPLGSNAWPDEFSQKISWMSTQQNHIAKLHLNPPDLGPLDVVLKISDNQATALFTSPHGAVRDAVENAMPKLREILADNGIMLGNATVSDQPPRDRSMNQGFGEAAQQNASGNVSESSGLSLAATQPAPVRHHNGLVDTFA